MPEDKEQPASSTSPEPKQPSLLELGVSLDFGGPLGHGTLAPACPYRYRPDLATHSKPQQGGDGSPGDVFKFPTLPPDSLF